MMREILFRGKAINREDGFYYRTNYKNGDWVYGLITKNYNKEYDFGAEMTNEIGISGIEVDYKTIGQYTSFTDKNGKKIFEGDICHFCGGAYYLGVWEYDLVREVKIDFDSLAFLENSENIEIIGNIYNNPELLKGDEKE